MSTAPFAGLIDDAAIFPPGEMPLPDAVPAHCGHHAAWYAGLVGPFVMPASRLSDLAPLLTGRPIALSVTLPADRAALESLMHHAAAVEGARLQAVEAALADGMPAGDFLAALDRYLPVDVLGYIEVPRDSRRRPTLDALAGTRYRAKFRTGGASPAAHPDERELAGAIHDAVTRGLPFKCTAGLHHAIRHTDLGSGFEQHGFLNVLLAADAALQGAGTGDITRLLAERSADAIVAGIRRLGESRMATARGQFVSFGSCSVMEPVRDLAALGLITQPRETWK
jgi:hypothetical protein